MEVDFYLFFIVIMLPVLLNDWLCTNLGERIIPVSRELVHLDASLSENYCSLDRNGIFYASICNTNTTSIILLEENRESLPCGACRPSRCNWHSTQWCSQIPLCRIASCHRWLRRSEHLPPSGSGMQDATLEARTWGPGIFPSFRPPFNPCSVSGTGKFNDGLVRRSKRTMFTEIVDLTLRRFYSERQMSKMVS
jgi:hypothetical protein